MEYNSNIQAELIGILANKPEYFSFTILHKNIFSPPHDHMFEVMLKSYQAKKIIDTLAIIEDPQIDDSYFMNIVVNVLRDDRIYFQHLEKQALEKWKEKEINEYNAKLQKGEIDIYQFTKFVDDVSKIDITKSKRLTSDNIKTFITKKRGIIKFKSFLKLQSYAKIREHDFVVVGGKTGTGKTGLALNLLSDLAKSYPCLYINIELSEETIIQRLIAINTGISMNELDNTINLSQMKIDRITRYAKTIDENTNIQVVSESQDINNIRRLVGGFNQDKHYIVIIDHIGRISSRGKSLYERMTNVAIELRNMSLDFNCTIIGLCQLSRDSVKEDKPSLNLLRDSGEIEQSARKVLFVWEEKNGDYYIYIKKNDSGINGKIPVIYEKNTQRFTERGAKNVRD